MHSRSKYWYTGIIFLLLFQVNVEAKNICNNTNNEQVITDGENEQFIPPHMCVSVSEDSYIVEEPEIVKQEVEPINIETKTQEPEVKVEQENTKVQNTSPTTEKEVEETSIQEETKSYAILVIAPLVILVTYIIIRRYKWLEK